MRLQDFEKEVIWTESMTGDSFQCVHVDYAREMRAELARLAAENERLRLALKSIILQDASSRFDAERMQREAKRAVGQSTEGET